MIVRGGFSGGWGWREVANQLRSTAKSPDSPLSLAWPAIDRAAEAARQQGWWFRTLPTDHSPHRTMPHELADLLHKLAQ